MAEHNRGRIQTPKSFTAPTTPSRVVKPTSPVQVSATTTSAENQPNASTSTTPLTSANAAAVLGGEPPEVVEKIKSQPLRAPPKKREPVEKAIAKGDISPENVPTTSTPAEDAEGVSPGPPPEEETPERSEPSISPPAPQSEAMSSPPSDPLHVAAQTYPWLYMSSTLDACFANVDKNEINASENPTAEENPTQPVGESEKIIRDESGVDPFDKEAPMIMQSFMSFGEVCERVETEAFQLAMSTPSLESREPLHALSAMMDNLDDLQKQASELESSILRLTASSSALGGGRGILEDSSSSSATTTAQNLGEEQEQEEPGPPGLDEDARQKRLDDANSARAQILGVFAACLPVLRARMANLSMAQELIDSAQENFSLALRMESMGIE